MGIHDALTGMQGVGLIESDEYGSFWKVTRTGREYITDPISLWWDICQEKLQPEHTQLLSLINHLSEQSTTNHVWLKQVNNEDIVAELGLSSTLDWLWPVAQELNNWGFVTGSFFLDGTMNLSATYKGLVWKTRRGFTLESNFIDDLVVEWETTSVDFKRELYTDTADHKAELIKDILSLTNTQASGRHWLIIGFDDKTHTYYGPPNKKLTQNHFEQLLSQYTTPMVHVRYEVVEYREGLVGKLEIRREPKQVPYRVAKSIIGDKKKIFQDQIFVRHGSQVEEPTPAELQALEEEGNRARASIR